MFDCLKDIVGISQAPCPCAVGNLPDDVKTALAKSTSELYTDDLEGGLTLAALKSTDNCIGFAQMALKARNNAIKDTVNELLISLQEKYAVNKKVYKGNIGHSTGTMIHVMQRRFGGIWLRPRELSDALIKITGFSIKVNHVAPNFALTILQVPCGSNNVNNDGVIIGTYAVAINQANVIVDHTFSDPIILPMRVEDTAVEYYIVYDRTVDGGLLPYDNQTSCGCGGAEKILNEFVRVDGVELDSLTALNLRQVEGYTHGLVLRTDIRCSPQAFVCKQYDEDNAVALVIAYAVRFRTGWKLIEDVLRSSDVSRLTLLDNERLWGKRNNFKKEYENRIAWLQQNVDISTSDCFICKDDNAPRYGGILA